MYSVSRQERGTEDGLILQSSSANKWNSTNPFSRSYTLTSPVRILIFSSFHPISTIMTVPHVALKAIQLLKLGAVLCFLNFLQATPDSEKLYRTRVILCYLSN